MDTLRLFPLNTVLFPGMPLTLHIFEERYKQMIGECLQDHQPFGVLLLRSGSEVLETGSDPIPYTVGCTAKIVQSQPLDGGRLNIVAVGQDRITVTHFNHSQIYLTGQVERLALLNPEPVRFHDMITRLRPWVDRYLSLLEKVENVRVHPRQLPPEDIALAYLAAALLKISPHQKQELLATANAIELAHRVSVLYRKEVTLSEALLAQPELTPNSPFSTN